MDMVRCSVMALYVLVLAFKHNVGNAKRCANVWTKRSWPFKEHTSIS